jgi:predicted nucleotidyltransferase
MTTNKSRSKFEKIPLGTCCLQHIKDIKLKEQIETQKAQAHAIILYGSYAKGENTMRSDIDILVIGSSEPVFIDASEEVNIQSFTWAEWKKNKENNKAFYDEIIQHGIALKGEVPVV